MDLMTEHCINENSINVHIKEPRLEFECTKEAIDEHPDFKKIIEVGKYYLIVGLNGERFYAKLIAWGNDNAEPIFGFDNLIKSKRMMGSDIEDDFTISYQELETTYRMFKVEYDEHNFLQLRHKGGRKRHFTRKMRRFPRRKRTRVSKKSRNALNRQKRKL